MVSIGIITAVVIYGLHKYIQYLERKAMYRAGIQQLVKAFGKR